MHAEGEPGRGEAHVDDVRRRHRTRPITTTSDKLRPADLYIWTGYKCYICIILCLFDIHYFLALGNLELTVINNQQACKSGRR